MEHKGVKRWKSKLKIVEKLQNAVQNQTSTELYVYGNNINGQLAMGEFSSISNVSVPKLLTVNFKIKEIACGLNFTMILATSGSVFAAGCNKYGQLGVTSQDKEIRVPTLWTSFSQMKVVKISCGHYHTAAITQDGSLYTWGFGKDGALGHGSQSSQFLSKLVDHFGIYNLPVISVSCGLNHTSAIVKDSHRYRLFMWGSNEYGQLGTKSESLIETLPKEIEFDESIHSVELGVNYSMLLTKEGKIYTCGDNSEGQLGIGNLASNGELQLVKSLHGIKIK